MMKNPNLTGFIKDKLGHEAMDVSLFERALVHPSVGRSNYQRLEFLGDRVLGLVMAAWLMERFPAEAEGLLSHRFTSLVSGSTCARVALAIGIHDHLRLGKQARDDGAARSENVLGDAVEALIGALYLDGGLEPAQRFIRASWAEIIESQERAPRHPKSLLIELAEGQGRKPPTYTVTDRTGPPHAPRFTVQVTVKGLGEAEGEGSSKQEAETAAAAALLEQLT